MFLKSLIGPYVNKNKTIDKIQKCLRLSESANANEAASALRQAHLLMSKFHISEHEVVDLVRESSAHSAGYFNPPYWAVALSDLIAQAFECRAYVQHREDNWPQFKFIGMGSSAEVAAYTFTYLYRVLRAARRSYMNENPLEDKEEHRRRGNVFAQAWLFHIAKTVAEFSFNGTYTEKIEEYVSAHYHETDEIKELQKEAADPEEADYEIIMSGWRAANKVSIYRPVVSLSKHKAYLGVCA